MSFSKSNYVIQYQLLASKIFWSNEERFRNLPNLIIAETKINDLYNDTLSVISGKYWRKGKNI